MVEEEKEEKEEEEEEEEKEDASKFKLIVIFIVVVLVAAMVYMYLHIQKQNRDLDYLTSLNVYEQVQQEEVLGLGTEEFDEVISSLAETAEWTDEVGEFEVRIDPTEDGEAVEGYGFAFGAEMGSEEIDQKYEDVRALLEEMGFELTGEQAEDLELPFVVFVMYEKDGIICTLTMLDIEEKEAVELEVGCFEETDQ